MDLRWGQEDELGVEAGRSCRGAGPRSLHTQRPSFSPGTGKPEGKPPRGRNAGTWPLQVWGPWGNFSELVFTTPEGTKMGDITNLQPWNCRLTGFMEKEHSDTSPRKGLMAICLAGPMLWLPGYTLKLLEPWESPCMECSVPGPCSPPPSVAVKGKPLSLPCPSAPGLCSQAGCCWSVRS